MRTMRLAILVLGLVGCYLVTGNRAVGQAADDRVLLPPPRHEGKISVEEAFRLRRSNREFGPGSLEMADVAQVLWAAQGITHATGHRTAPSAGATYPLEVYLVAGEVAELAAGVYRYLPEEHSLILVQKGDLRERVASAAHSQACIRRAPAVLVITGIYQRTARKYGQRAHRYVQIEVGHAAQNVYLQCAAADLATVFVGSFTDDEVQEILGLPSDHAPLGLMPLGRIR